MKKVLALVSVLSLAAMASAVVDVRLWLAPAASGQVPFTGTGTAGPGGPFSPTLVGADTSTGGVGAHIYTSATIATGGTTAPAAQVPTDPNGAGGEIYGIWARTDNPTGEGSAIRGMALQLSSTGTLAFDVAWAQWRGGAAPNFTYTWEASSDFVGNDVTLVGGLGGPGAGWVFGTSGARQDDWTVTDPDAEPILGVGEILLGYIRTTAGAGGLQIRLGANGVNHAQGTTVALGDSPTRIDGGVGAAGRGSGDQLVVIPEPASLVLLALAGLALRRR